MKRIRFIISLSILAVCMCALTFGVVAAFSKNLTTSGKVGFSANDCDVDVSCMIIGSVNVVDSSAEVSVTSNNISYNKTKVTNNMFWTVPDLYFDEYTSTTVPDIVFTFTVENSSSFTISATATQSAEFITNIGDDLEVTIVNDAEILSGESGTVTITLSVNNETPNLNFGVDFDLFNLVFERI